jgi:hypothetical protein
MENDAARATAFDLNGVESSTALGVWVGRTSGSLSLGRIHLICGKSRSIRDLRRTPPRSAGFRPTSAQRQRLAGARYVQFGDVGKLEVELFCPRCLVAPRKVGNDEQFHGASASHVSKRMSLDRHSCRMAPTQRSANAFRFGLLGGRANGRMLLDRSTSRNAAQNLVSRS